MIFVIKSSSKPYEFFKNNIKFILYFIFILKLTCFILMNSCIIFQISFYLNLMELKLIIGMFIKQISF
jgi:hypothetical protein